MKIQRRFTQPRPRLSKTWRVGRPYPRFNQPRRVVFAVEKPVDVNAGAVLKLTMRQDAQSTGITAQVIRRARYSMSDDAAWCDLVAAQSVERQRLAEIAGTRSKIPSVAVPIMREQHASQRREFATVSAR